MFSISEEWQDISVYFFFQHPSRRECKVSKMFIAFHRCADVERDCLDDFLDNATDPMTSSRRSSLAGSRGSGRNVVTQSLLVGNDSPFDWGKCVVDAKAMGFLAEDKSNGALLIGNPVSPFPEEPSPEVGRAGSKLPFNFALLCERVKVLNHHSGPGRLCQSDHSIRA